LIATRIQSLVVVVVVVVVVAYAHLGVGPMIYLLGSAYHVCRYYRDYFGYYLPYTDFFAAAADYPAPES